MPEHDHSQPHTPDEEAGLALEALAHGDMPHAAFHLGVVLASDATNPDWLALLDKLIAGTEKPLELAPLVEGEVHFITAALHAYILAKLGRKAEAVDVLLQVIMALPVNEETTFLPFLDWAIQWVDDPTVVQTFPLSRIVQLLGWMLEHYPGLVVHRERQRSVLQHIWLFVRKIPGDVPRDVLFHFGYASLLRKLGWFNDALAAAEAAYQQFPGYHAAMVLAMAHEAREEFPSWLDNVRIAMEHNPQDIPTRVDVADKLWNLDRKEEAAEWYEEVLQKQPEHPWAKPSLLALRYEQSLDRSYLEQLGAFAAAHPDNRRAGPLLQKYMPYIGFLPEPAEETVRILTEFFEQFAGPPNDEPQVVRIKMPWLEAPSAQLVGDLQVKAVGWPLEFAFDVEQIPQPDPRLPSSEVEYLLWKYDGTVPIPAVPPPDPELAEAISDFAFSPFRLDEWLGRAHHLAQQIDRENLQGLLGVMVHPPDLPQNVPPWLWIQHVQIAATLTIAWLDESETWETSLRRKVLFDLACGPLDWTVSAAIIALMAIAQVDTARQEEILRLFIELLSRLPEEGYACHVYPLVCCALYLPAGTPELKEELKQWKAILEEAE